MIKKENSDHLNNHKIIAKKSVNTKFAQNCCLQFIKISPLRRSSVLKKYVYNRSSQTSVSLDSYITLLYKV